MMENRFYCEHCGEKVSKTLYYQHKKLYYTADRQHWERKTNDESFHLASEEDFTFSDHEDNIMEAVDDEDTTADDYVPVNSIEDGDTDDNDNDFNFDEGDKELTEIFFDDDDVITRKRISFDSRVHQLVRSYIMFLFTWQTLFRVSDAGMGVLFIFIAVLLGLLASGLNIKTLNDFIELLPRNVAGAKKFIGHFSDEFSKYASCPKCHSIYALDTCKIIQPDKTLSSRTCSFVEFPNHPHTSRRKRCNTPLMKTVRTSFGTTSLYPRQLYCYQSVIDSLRSLVRRPGFVEKCELWRERSVHHNLLTDVYDGRVWKSFLNPGGVPFLSLPFNFALSLNVDWFQPFKHTTYSTGALYIAIQNLPRKERYNTNNVLLVGVIPGPSEPKRTMNSYLDPLVKELDELWNGVIMQSSLGNPVLVRSALICTACDIPASRKISGFVGHNARLACSRCLKVFPTAEFGEKPDYTGTDRSTWTPRTIESHREQALMHKTCDTRSQQIDIERSHGCRYSSLIKLPYYDAIKFCVVDPMHNLLLGTAKHMISVWISLGIIGKKHLLDIQETVDHFITPSDIGRIPAKIACGQGFSNFTAEQWRNWTLIYSLCALKEIIPREHYDCWLMFVKATNILCRRQVSLSDIEEGDTLLMGFCVVFERLYGKENYTINLHLHGHIKECMLDYGPVYSFWLFAFERLNGVLGSYRTNSHDISLQLMRRFVSTTEHGIHNWPTEFKDHFTPLIKHQYQEGSLRATSIEQALRVHKSEDITPLPPVQEAAWSLHEKGDLLNLVQTLVQDSELTILALYAKATALSIGGFTIGSTTSRFVTRAHMMAAHPRYPDKIFLCRIEHFNRVNFEEQMRLEGSRVHSVWTACVSFYDEHDYKAWFGGPTQIWTRSIFDVCYVCLSHIKCQVAYCETEVDFGGAIGKQTVFVVSLLSNISL